MHTGHAVSPVFRFMASNGGWIWMQMEGMLRYKPGTKERQFWEVKSKILRYCCVCVCVYACMCVCMHACVRAVVIASQLVK